MFRFFVIFAVLHTAALFVSGCKFTPKQERSDLQTVFFAKGVWPSSKFRVCWEFMNESTAWFTAELRSVVGRAFEDTQLEFNGWGVCPQDLRDSDLRLFIYDDSQSRAQQGFDFIMNLMGVDSERGHPRVRSIGPQMRESRANVVLNLTGLDSALFLLELYNSLTDEGKKNLAFSSSLHEFGHAIGLRHENAHPENTCPTFDENLVYGDTVIGGYNAGSFMQRCLYRNYDYEKGIVWPNELDIKGINAVYR